MVVRVRFEFDLQYRLHLSFFQMPPELPTFSLLYRDFASRDYFIFLHYLSSAYRYIWFAALLFVSVVTVSTESC